jgi:hypothetical protein
VLALAAERAVERVLRIAVANLAHFRAPTKMRIIAVATRGLSRGSLRLNDS